MSRPGRPPSAGADEDAPEWWRRSAIYRRVPIIAVVVITIVIIRATQESPPPELETSCETPGFVVSDTTFSSHHALRWSATGRAGERFLLTFGADRLETDDRGLTPVPAPGVAADVVRSTGSRTMPADCTADGAFGIVAPPGRYPVRMFVVPDGGPPRQAAEQVVAVTPG